jgi:hypothetical protein
MRRWLRRSALFVVGAFVAIQFIPVDRSAPVSHGEPNMPTEVRSLLRRACFDCHSNETDYPWYGYVAPVSWLVARDVVEGREALDFTQWSRYDAADRSELLWESFEEIVEGEMPLKIYTALHPEARLSTAEVQDLKRWIAAQGGAAEEHWEEDD